MSRKKRKRTKEQVRLFRESVLFWLGLTLFSGQLCFHWLGGVPLDWPPLVITGAMVLAPVFGKDFFLELVRAVRGTGDGSGDGDDRG